MENLNISNELLNWLISLKLEDNLDTRELIMNDKTHAMAVSVEYVDDMKYILIQFKSDCRLIRIYDIYLKNDKIKEAYLDGDDMKNPDFMLMTFWLTTFKFI